MCHFTFKYFYMKKRLLTVLGTLCMFLAGAISATNLNAQVASKSEIHSTAKQGDWTVPIMGISVNPIFHASLELGWKGKTLLFDPSFPESFYNRVKKPDVIFITDIHGDHLDTAVLTHFAHLGIPIIVPKAVFDLLPTSLKKQAQILSNGQKTSWSGMEITAIAMYNLADAQQMFHPKGRGNGYVLSMGGKRVYISGDTEDTPELRGLKNIDLAFVCMNLPYTMDIQRAARGVLAFKPAVVVPYHYKGEGGLSDIKKFKELVQSVNPKIRVDLLNFYPSMP